ncbi:M24 family metallopeptidase, partial [bacterium]|nr:M24 family metallopeptidase [candidate division CSSED10-310 bacterium]
KGRASDRLKRMYEAVLEAQEASMSELGPGADGKRAHEAVLEIYRRRGYKTRLTNGRIEGYFHGTGHGVGLEIHEAPSIGGGSVTLQPGHVVTVEPGLYYHEDGAVRLEDTVVITADGCRNLMSYPKVLEVP